MTRITRTTAACAVLAVASLGCLCSSPPSVRVGQGPQAAGEYPPLAATGPTSWTVDGQPFQIHSTYYVVIDGEGQYVAEWVVPEGTDIPSENAAAEALALPLMLHIVRQGLHRRQRITKAGAGPVDIEWIGVALMRRQGVRTSGFRVRRRISELQAAVER